jgi:hypothetical protein
MSTQARRVQRIVFQEESVCILESESLWGAFPVFINLLQQQLFGVVVEFLQQPCVVYLKGGCQGE